MRLNQASDFAMRILMMLSKEREAKTVDEISAELVLVKSHVMKIVAKLVKAGILKSTRGRAGGISLAKRADQITVGSVVRVIEADFAIVECMQPGESKCTFAPSCKLRGVMGNAKSAFLDALDQQTLQGLVI